MVVVPTFNERPNIDGLISAILALGDAYRLVVVDDNSPDGTGAAARDWATRFPGRVSVLERAGKSGIGSAYRAGFAVALTSGADVIAQMDADFSHDPAALPSLVRRTASADVVLGSRYVEGGGSEGWPWHRRALSRAGGVYARIVLGVPIRDLTGGFKAYRRSALARIAPERLTSDGYVFQIETTYRAIQAGLNVVEVPIIFTDRVAGRSKLSRRIVLEAMIVIWRLRFGKLARRT